MTSDDEKSQRRVKRQRADERFRRATELIAPTSALDVLKNGRMTVWEGMIDKETKQLLRRWIDEHCEREESQGPEYYRVDDFETLAESAYRLGFGHGRLSIHDHFQ